MEIVEVRDKYHKGIQNEQVALDLAKAFETQKPKNVILKGYEGANQMILAKFGWLPNQKLYHFNTGKKLLEESISIEPNGVELIYLRYSIQLNSPSFLGYNKNLIADRLFLLKHTRQLEDADLRKRITAFLILEAKLNPNERKMLE